MKHIFLLKSVLILVSVLTQIAVYAQNTPKPDSLKNLKRDTTKLILKIKSLDSVKTKIDTTNAATVKLQKQNAVLNKSLDSLAAFRSKTKANIDSMIRIAKKLQKNNAKLENANKELQRQYKAYQDTINTFKTAVDKFKSDVDTLNNAKQKLQKETDKLNTKSKNLSDSVADLNKSVETAKATIAKQMDSLEVIATIEMNDWIKVFKIGRKQILFKTKVQSVHMLVKEGVILEINIVTDSGTFRNKSAIIDLLHFGKRVSDHLEYETQNYRRDADS